MLPRLQNNAMMPDFIDDFFNDETWPSFFRSRTGVNVPSVNIVESNDDYRIEVAAPGLDKDDFNVNVDNNVLTISSEKETKDEDKDENFVRKEFSYSSFNRSFTLPEGTDADKIKANHKDGVLFVTVPKTEEVKKKAPKSIKIS